MVSPSRGCVTRAARDCVEEGETAGGGVTWSWAGHVGTERLWRAWLGSLHGYTSPEGLTSSRLWGSTGT